MVVAAQKVVLTQPTSGDIKAFSTRCTHQGCAVSSVKDGYILCPCHGSRFAIADGAPTADSPAKQPLASAAVTVSGDKITLA
jgi:Rieske Fe-S protein